ncbi:Histidine kinase-like ATPase, C-terminal domain containing protein [Parasponia andersonii]|uniref:Histidine kinase-like ATPase, C-terminal domain containing protein n=1 Tax=Parasponia andersonii TaxID=3476 RepID=A0A2P5CT91_PARAD|nr:Histidine kinase-like ATPase, C-terminal domain containing protein [Parasponia andersonii]
MLLSANSTLNPLLSNFSNPDSVLLFPHNSHHHKQLHTSPKLTPNSSHRKPFTPINASSSVQNPNALHYVTTDEDSEEAALVSSASAVASAIRAASTSPVEFAQRIEKDPKSGLVLPSSDFQRLCVEQLDLFRRIVDPEALLSVYVRPAGSYVMDRLELRRVTAFPGVNAADVVILVGSFSIPAGLRAAEAVLSNQQVELIPEYRAAVFPMVKHPFVVGFLVAEFRSLEQPSRGNGQSQGCDSEKAHDFSLDSDPKSWDIQTLKDESLRMYKFTAEQTSNAINISRSLAMAYVMDQKAMLLQQSSWQNNVRMSNLVEQIRGPLSSIRTLSKMLSLHTRRGEISYDIVEDILVQGDRMKDTLQQLQDAVHLTKANIVRYNEETLKKMLNSTFAYTESVRPHLSDDLSRDNSSNKIQSQGDPLPLNTSVKDLEMPMPPPALAPLKQHEIRPCDVSDVLADLVEAVSPLAHKQQRLIKLSELEQALQVAIEEPALRQALSNLIEGALLRTHIGGRVEIVCIGAPAGGALVVIDDDGPDMHFMTQMHSLTPFGVDLCSENMVEDNMTWNFVAGLTVAREILESYGCVVRVISPRTKDAALGAGGTRVELWLPCFAALSDFDGPAQML